MAAESCFAGYSCFVSIFFTNYVDFTKTIIHLALMASESIESFISEFTANL